MLNKYNQACTRHIHLRYNWVIQRVEMGHFEVVRVGTTDMAADGLTKGLSQILHDGFVRQLHMTNPEAQEE